MALTGKQTRHLRSLGHHLDPVVQIGKNGITEALVAQLSEAILRHELLKVKLLPECPLDRHEAGEEAAKAIGADLVQTLGRTLLFWKRNPQAARIELPKASGKARKKVTEEPAASAPATSTPAPAKAPPLHQQIMDEDGMDGDGDDEPPRRPARPAPRAEAPARREYGSRPR